MTTAVAYVPARKPRPRRIAADEAHAWARNLRLNNPFAKLVLSMLTLYVDCDGKCFVGIEALAEDTELSSDTVRKRLAWLEMVGAIARFPQWVDGSGRRNSEERGKRTTDEIRLLMASDADMIERRAQGDDCESPTTPKSPQSGPDAGVTPRSQQGQQTENENDQGSVSPGLALGQPSDSGEGLDSSNLEPEPESPPTPFGGVRVERSELDEQLDAWIEVLTETYPIPITDMPRTRALGAAMSERERGEVITGARGYRTFIDGERRRTGGKGRSVKDAHRWIRDGGHLGYLQAGKQAEARAGRYSAAEGSEQWIAWMTFHRLCGEMQGIPEYQISPVEGGRVANVPTEWPPVGRGLESDYRKWQHKAVQFGDARGASFAAWARRLRELPNVRLFTRSEDIDGERRAILIVPSEFPPAKGGAPSAGG